MLAGGMSARPYPRWRVELDHIAVEPGQRAAMAPRPLLVFE